MPLTALYSFSFNGQVFGGAGSPYQITAVDGLEGLPGIRSQDDNRGYNDGMFSGQDFLAGRHITVTMQVLASGMTSAQANLNTLQQALLPQKTGTTPLYFQITGTEQFINARVRSFSVPITPDYTYGLITAQVTFFAPMPMYYDSTQQSATLQISPPPGRTYNRTYNLVYGGGSASTSTSVVNNGWATTYPIITISGPVSNPIVGNVTQNNYLNFIGTYTNTDQLVVDLGSKLITLNGAPARNLLLSGNWFDAQPGTNLFYFTGTNTLPGTTQATVTWYSAYI